MQAAQLAVGAAILLGLCGPAWSYDAQGNRSISSWGNATCRQITDADEQFGDAAARVYKAYIEAYASAVNDFKPGKADFFVNTDTHSRYQHVLSYCRAHPAERVVRGISDMLKKSGVEREPTRRKP